MKPSPSRSFVIAASSLTAATVLLGACAGSMMDGSSTGLSFFVTEHRLGQGR